MNSTCGRLAVLVCAGAIALASCSSGGGSTMIRPYNDTAVESVLHASSYVRLMSDTVAVNSAGGFTLTSATFQNNGRIPLTMIGNVAAAGCNGGDLSPALVWSNPPPGTKSFALVLFDETANFGHWGIYNMRPGSNRLAQGVKLGNLPPNGVQVYNDVGVQGYFGPCPPPGIVHRYVFTIYALDTTLSLAGKSGLNPPLFESLLNAMTGHVIARASITGLLQKS